MKIYKYLFEKNFDCLKPTFEYSKEELECVYIVDRWIYSTDGSVICYFDDLTRFGYLYFFSFIKISDYKLNKIVSKLNELFLE